MYAELEKNEARNTFLSKAILDLTESRSSSFILNHEEVLTNYKEAVSFLRKTKAWDLKDEEYAGVINPAELACQGFRSKNETKQASALKVLFLCGPNPLNDIEVFVKHGILPQNIFAVESNKSLYQQALTSISGQLMNVKMYNGELSEFLKSSNEKFDIVYFDACSPFCNRSPDTLKPILELFVNNRLTPLSALITNFSEVKDKKDYFAGLMASYFSPRYNDYPFSDEIEDVDPEIYKADPSGLKKIVLDHVSLFYSDFITRLIVDLGRFLIPTARALTFKGIRENMLNEKEIAFLMREKAYKDTVLSEGRSFDDLMDWELNPSGYPLYCFVKNIPELTNDSSFFNSFSQFKINGKDIRELLPVASLLNSILEGHWGLVSKQFLSSIVNIWFDYRPKYFCDFPLPNLLINSHLGALGGPYHLNTRKMLRATYTAKKTKMYMDYFPLDACTEFYNWLPSIDMTKRFFEDIRMQLIARSMIDRLGRYDWRSTSHPFRGSALFGLGEIEIAKEYEIPERIELGSNILGEKDRA